ncbi:MAG: thrombospondin type 3 repeat-containing protein, partial [Glaciecola sp.]
SSYGQNSFEFESSGYTLTVTSVKDGSPAKIANQGGVNNQGVNIDYGLGVKGASGDSGPWEITEGEGLVFSLSDGSGAVNFYNTAFNTPLNPADNSPIKNLYGNERVTLTFNGTTYTASGGQNVSIIDGSLASDGSSTWANELASSFTLTAVAEVAGSSPATGLRVSGLSMRIDTNPNTDADGDTVSDTLDNCPSIPNADQANLDNDEFGDACDNDRDGDGVNNDADVFPDNSAETLDSDSDTLGDNADNCPLISNLDQADVDQDGVGNVCDADADGDGVLNTFELALNTDPLDASDGAQAASDLLAGLSGGDQVTIPMMGGFGLFALAISIFGLGVFSRRQQ